MKTLISFLFALAAFSFAQPAGAGSHQWRFSEFYSSPDKQIQFIEMQEIASSSGEANIQNGWFATDTYNLDHSQTLGTSLPFGTADKTFLVGSESYAALPGVPAPDYILPDGILEPSGDTILWWNYQTLTIPAETMPSDGTASLHLVDPSNAGLGFITGPNSPKNFDGETGTVVLPTPLPTSSEWGTISSLAIIAVGTWALGWRNRSSSPERA
ncbi:MAG: hypothetical protein JRG89_04065 [Deltaproteobacteria bacterium]|nr:hypothetical protein [Deltaproteobacteria bacterium]MBW2387590.1 hypothetical protein [Deltaproteobacteria bacterium]